MSAAYAQPGKRQKVRERVDNVDYFQGIDKVDYNNMATATDTTSYRYYSQSERVHSRAMEDWLKFSVSFTDFRSNYSDHHSKYRPWDDHTNTLENNKRCIKALFDFCGKLGVKYWTAFDSDLIPQSDSWEETKAYWDDIVEYIQELAQRSHVKLLWLAPDLHSHARFASGALTSSDAITTIQAVTQIKKCLEVSQRLNAECFLIWPYREGYDAIFQTDVPREIKLFGKLLKLTAEYKDRLNYRCQLLIMPYYNYSSMYYNNCNKYHNGNISYWRGNDAVNSYMWDVTSCLYFLRNYNLERYYKVCTPPGHQMYMANVYNMLGGVVITNEFDQFDSKKLTLMMKSIVDQGTTLTGGIHLKLTPRRDGDAREIVTMYVKYIDAIARGLRVACSIISEQMFSKYLQQRYTSYYTGFGSRLVSNEVSMEECEEYYKKSLHNEMSPAKSQHLDVALQRYVDSCDHM